jgi:hypothetical protein
MLRRHALAGALALWLVGCGGGDGHAAAINPAAGPASQQPVASSVTVFANPSPQDYAVVGVSTPDAGGGYDSVAEDARLRTLLFEPADQPRIRYTSRGRYEVQLPGSTYDTLVHYKGLANPSPDNNFFQPQGVAANAATLIISLSRLDGYVYSEIASWTAARVGIGFAAFGTATPAIALPPAGRATYRGNIAGLVDVTYPDNLYGGYAFEGVVGTVTLDVDFATRVATASFALTLRGVNADIPIGTFTSAPMTLPPSTNGLSGTVITAESGFNRVDGLFTGPAATEAIGRIAIPVSINGAPHQVMGAWIAAKP